MAPNKSILFLNNVLYPFRTGGIEIFHYYFIAAVSQKKRSILMTLSRPDFKSSSIKTCTTKGPYGKLQTLFTIYHHLYQIINRRQDIGIIHIPYSSKPVFQFYHVMCAARILNIPYVLRIHGGGMYPARPNFMHALYFKNASGVIAVSAPIKEEYERRYQREIKLLPSYLPFLQSSMSQKQLRQKIGLPLNSTIFLCLGSVKKIKGTDILIDAAEILGKEFIKQYNMYFVVVGGGDLEAALRSRVTHLGLNEVIRFTGSISYEYVHEYYQAADVFVIPSLMEARPLALAEALYNGLPAIGSNISTISNTISHNEHGLLFPVGSSEALADSMKFMACNPLKRSLFRENNFRRREVFNRFDEMVQDYMDYYDQIML